MEMKKLLNIIKTNLNGTFKWSTYVEEGDHDHKFGPNKTDFICQMPVVGLIALLVVHLLIYSLIAILYPYRLFRSYTEKK
ncbi:hypothetical protein ABNavy1_005 [Acinetobacter phage AB-Navy1]|uniref:Uncharacterized protein n=3 Tax=Lazarusvirus TaxID=2842820 RepID=A0A4Y1NLC1_9CAUD|nr:hypothetical protein HYQ23_gp004 [Acinetobacter phage vB_AbaM_Lazarus]YP_009889635.1 hypothetical protein HYP65_gp004 [Acinetobacter phage AM101]QKN87943.1 hypothetical protein Abraxas_004 [Acinetobacter phage Abraxas]UJH94795.1 hypothetical protein PhaR5_060 [Acinetobacter phage PhaR5]UQS93835.1 hypothetical protein ABNavy1_005 [Acinetobacter phage AB-Navy1]AWY10421.1 hypothetical protein AM101_004 [Acinetobacter phage AM101]QHJ73940.1 hypothetical protein Lazarus_004 [Acinetobacter phage